ncbi:hypothetical protein KW843_07580 [Acidovorax sp. sif1233]|uniref:hypothetical protein n=1 Tax=Acidovorax sp. sif1233 TaxID=2854792 RepID=UPI001C477297|nr:hypothetical protein [Acidovorax sp. sif1233]MBV7454327.1 hypothetical protein [Acidovorax sp. sif1233]
MSTALRTRVLRVLLAQGKWVDRAALNRLTTCQPALDDVLADLVIEGHAEFRKFAGYRLCGGPQVRAARLQLAADPTLVRAVSAATQQAEGGEQVVMGVAERRPELGGAVVTYQMELPVCGSPGEALAQAQALVGFCKTGLLAGLGGQGNA